MEDIDDDDENEIDDMKETEEEKENVRIIVQEIRRANWSVRKAFSLKNRALHPRVRNSLNSIMS
jgi:hypothetical protein